LSNLPEDFSIHVKMRIERKGKPILGPGRFELLKAIDQTGSLTEATKLCNISFRKGWKLIDQINKELEQPIIISERGGTGGGGRTFLTEYGKKLIQQYEHIQEVIQKTINDPKIWL
jgi:molybdate transport system regulatory protein